MSGTPVAGQSFTLTCSHTTTVANPTSTSYQWFHPNGSMAGSEAALTLNPLLESQSGEYSCQVTVTDANESFGCGVIGINVQGRNILSSIHPLTTVKYCCQWMYATQYIPTLHIYPCLLYTSPSPRDATLSRMPSSA